jgi:hypothetical protein
MSYERQIAAAKRSIASKGEACTWNKPVAEAAGADPWRDVRDEDADPLEYPVRIAWFSPRDLGRGTGEFLAALTGQEVPEGVMIGLMAGGQGFEPTDADWITRADSSKVEPMSIDRLAPDGTPILYFVKVAL